MGLIATEWLTARPSHMEPRIIMQINQASGFARTLAGGGPRVQLDSEDKFVYIRRADMRATMVQNPAAGEMLPNANIIMSMIQCPTYLQRVRAEYNHHDTAMAGHWGIGLPEAQSVAMRQAHFQLLRDRTLFGANPLYGEGLLNTSGATTTTLPPDSFGNTTVLAYDNGQMALWLLQQVLAMKTRTYQLGTPRRFTFLGPQRTLGLFEYNIVQLTSYQRAGGGTASTTETLKAVAGDNGDVIEWAYDDTLIGQGAGGDDAVILVMPEVDPHISAGPIDTNEFAKLSEGFNANTLLYTDVAAPIEIPTPLPGGAIDVLSEMRATPGWGVRPEAVAILSLPY